MSPILKKKLIMKSPRRTFLVKAKEDKGPNSLISATLPTPITKPQLKWANWQGLQRRKLIKNFIILSQSYPLAWSLEAPEGRIPLRAAKQGRMLRSQWRLAPMVQVAVMPNSTIQMDFMRVTMFSRSMAWEDMSGAPQTTLINLAKNITVNGKIIKSMDLGPTPGQMEDSIMESGAIISCMGLACILGLMANCS